MLQKISVTTTFDRHVFFILPKYNKNIAKKYGQVTTASDLRPRYHKKIAKIIWQNNQNF